MIGDLGAAQRTIDECEQHPERILVRRRIAIARAFTVEPIVPFLRAAAYREGIALDLHLGELNAYAQELLDPGSALYRFKPDIVILATNTETIAPPLYRGPTLADETVAHYAALITAFRKNSSADLIVHNLDQPDRSSLAEDAAAQQRAAIASVNERLYALAERETAVYVLDYDALVARHGRRSWRDEAKWQRFMLPAASQNLPHIAQEWLHFIQPLTGAVAKVAAVDLDNTLWGGIVGEDGFERLRMGAEYPGSCYRAVQQALLALRERGIVLAVCSKNNPTDALDVIDRHPDMLLRREHFAAIYANWEPKSKNLEAVARDLNVGIDAVALIDDNPVERLEAKSALPQLRIIDLPGDPARYAGAIADATCFARLRTSSEDRLRADYYRQERERKEFAGTIPSREDFLRSLEQEAQIEPATEIHVARVAQLTQKTNQFNLTTRRYSEAQVRQFIDDPAYQVVVMKLRDRFGDSGLIGVAIVRSHPEPKADFIVDTFLMSCRVIGRGAETALLAYLVEHARELGKKRITATFHPTAKNEPAKSFLPDHGFRKIADAEDHTTWELSLETATIEAPDYFTVSYSQFGHPQDTKRSQAYATLPE
jgi:FkbH-like protein